MSRKPNLLSAVSLPVFEHSSFSRVPKHGRQPKKHTVSERLRLGLFFLLGLSIFSTAVGQSDYVLPNVINPSPQSQALTRYGDYPMADYTGLTDITVPLHTVKGRKLGLPIAMSFHASGRMANEQNGILGMRWTLNCGGLVTRTMKGLPDEWSQLTPFDAAAYFDYSNGVPFDVLYSACPDGKFDITFNPDTHQEIPKYDSEFDVFDYVLPNGKQGHFILKNQNGTKVPMTIPYQPLRIEYVKDQPVSGYIGHVTITDDDGTRYVFGGAGTSTGDAVEITWECDIDILNLYNAGVPTAWYLTKIVSCDGVDSILLSYNAYTMNSYVATESANVGDRMRNNAYTYLMGGSGDYYADDFLIPYYTNWHVDQPGVVLNHTPSCAITTPRLSGVQFYGGSVSLSYAGNILSEMVVKRDATPYKKIKFGVSRHAGESEVSYLDSLAFYGEDQSVAGERYAFGYYEGDNMEPITTAATHKDWWGYYSRAANDLLPYQQVGITMVPAGNEVPVYQKIGSLNVVRGGSEYDKQMGMLKTITYPAGGQTEFVYEGNKYDNGVEGPGLRTKETISTAVQGTAVHKIYRYGTGENGIGAINKYLRPGSGPYNDLTATEGITMYYWTQDGLNSYMLASAGFRTRNFFSDPYLSFGLSGSPVKYAAVTEYYVKDGVPQQKTQTRYSWSEAVDKVSDFTVVDHDYPIVYTRKFVDPQYVWLRPVMTDKTVFRYTNGQFDTARSERYEYDSTQKDEAWDMPTYLHTNVVYTRSPQVGYTTPYGEAKEYHNDFCSVYGYGFRRYTTGVQQLYRVLTREHTTSGIVTTDKHIDYNTYNLVSSESVTNSRTGANTVTYKYPSDFPNDPVCQQMVQRHMLSPVLETVQATNGVQARKVTTAYYSPHTDMYVPRSVTVQSGGVPANATAASFNAYDVYGNVQEQQKTNDAAEAYLWGYGGRYPVAKVVGGTLQAVQGKASQATLDNPSTTDAVMRTELDKVRAAFKDNPLVQVWTYTYKPLVGMTSETDPRGSTAFYEYDGFGRLTHRRDRDNNVMEKHYLNYGGLPYYNAEKSVVLTRNNCAVGAVGGSVIYIVPAKRYWSTVSQTDADQMAQDDIAAAGQDYANRMGRCTYTNTAQSGVFTRSDCASGGTQVTYTVPAGAATSTVSQADADQRAMASVNADGPAYANIHGGCATYYNTVQTGYFAKNNCGTGYQGSSVTYTVPAKKYTSTTQPDADQKARNDVTANGQAYANANGACTKVCTFAPTNTDNIHIMKSSITDNNNGTVSFSIDLDIDNVAAWEELMHGYYNIGSIVGDCRSSQDDGWLLTDNHGVHWFVEVDHSTFYLYLSDELPHNFSYSDYFPATITGTFNR